MRIILGGFPTECSVGTPCYSGFANDLEAGLAGVARVGTEGGKTEAHEGNLVDLTPNVASANIAEDGVHEGGLAQGAGVALESDVSSAIAADRAVATDSYSVHSLLGAGVSGFLKATEDKAIARLSHLGSPDVVGRRFSSGLRITQI